ncbi:MAG: monovalent cation/H+ antiporter subunit D [Candidatus Ozemobacter sibiricus]|jgi:formate hydrogenlyase subunit 3/multisubunit Na+/H+ antiporter MnhD subunit|uniref:Monovalent cation/H+ antiporter subunit D n=1 Tax=Candidatus Ozemobacter sibiricus TaxID=2268124 RepID=A0A367ZKN3_9BACT|nr:MAG: monovalent cation/H+ antiporter subunit D [Candidatus Ozemobacter sibiricus]
MNHAPVLVVLVPLLAALASLLLPPRLSPWLFGGGLAGVGSLLIPLYQRLLAAGPFRYRIGGWGWPLGIDFYIDGTGFLMLAMTWALLAGIGWYSLAYFRGRPAGAHFWPLLLLVWAALDNLFVTADVFNMYVTLELLGLLSVALIALAGTPEAYAAALRYLLAALGGSMCYLLGVAMIYSVSGTLDWVFLRTVLTEGPGAVMALALVTAGLMLKSAIFPLHFWLPRAHANAPAPVSALLSSLMVKASFYISLRMWLWIFPGVLQVHVAGPLLGLLGAGAILYGSLMALQQTRLKLLIAYSTVAQLGYLFVFFALSMHPEDVTPALQAVVFFALSHAFAKAALFMGAGVVQRTLGHDALDRLAGSAQRLPQTVFAFGVAGVSLIGLPPSGGFVGKYLLIDVAIRERQWFWAVVLAVGGLLAGAYVFKILARAMTEPPAASPAPSLGPSLAASAASSALTGEGAPPPAPAVVASSSLVVEAAASPLGHADSAPPERGLVWSTWTLAMTAFLLGLLALHPLQVIAIGAPGAGPRLPGAEAAQ